MPSREEIQASLRAFVAEWKDYSGSEKSEAQTFLNELFGCYGSDRRELGARFEHFAQHAGFMDLFWPGTCIVEMKAPTVPVASSDGQHSDVIRPYLDSEDIATNPDQASSRWTIDFGLRRLEDAAQSTRTLELLRQRVLAHAGSLTGSWWRFLRPRPAMRSALLDLDRFIAVGRHGKRMSLAWCDARVMATDATNVFAFDDDYSMGVLLSKAHDAWAWARASTLKGDLRYTPRRHVGCWRGVRRSAPASRSGWPSSTTRSTRAPGPT